MKIKKKLKILKEDNNSKEENNNTVTGKTRRVYLELSKTDIYSFSVDVPVKENTDEENTTAIMAAWDIINRKLMDIEKFRKGGGFQQKILKRELIKEEKKEE